MKTKKITLGISIMALFCLVFNNSAMSQEVNKNLSESILRATPAKCQQKASGHFATFPGQSDNGQPLSKKSANSVNYHADTVFRYSINNGSERTVTLYDNHGNPLTTLKQIWIINKWVNNRLTTNTFDGNDNMLTETAQFWESNNWVNDKMIVHTYDGAGNCLNTLGKEWDGINWENWGQSDYTYDGSGNMLTEIFREWDGSDWVNSTLDSCTYNGTGNCLTAKNLQWDGMGWMYNMLEISTYDGNGKILTDWFQFWDGMMWSDMFRVTFTNNGDGNRTSSLEEFWDGMMWMNSYKDTLMYDANGNYIAYINYNCYDGMTWEEYSRGDFTYNSDGNMLTRINQMWNMGGWENYVKVEYTYPAGLITADAYTWTGTAWTSGDEYFSVMYNDAGTKIMFYTGESPAVQVLVYYSSVTSGIDDQDGNLSELVTIYPNPATDHLFLNPANPAVKIEKLQILDLSGKEQHIISSHNRVDLGNLQHGLYFLRITLPDGQVLIKKIVKH